MRRTLLLAFALLPGVASGQDYIYYYPPSSSIFSGGPYSGAVNFSPATGVSYYLDYTGGNDGNDGLSTAAPWKTLAKVNGFTFASGDRVYLKAGEVWRETLTVPGAGMRFSSYGAGAAPRITGVPVLSGVAEETGGVFVSGLEDESDLFTTDFTNKGALGGNTITVSTDIARTGAKSGKMTFAGASQDAYAYKQLAGQTDLWVRGWFYVKQSWAQGAATKQTNLMQLYDSGNGIAATMGLSSLSPADAAPWLYCAVAANGPTYTIAQPVIVSPEVWHRFEFHWIQGNGTGGAGFYLDGVLVASDFTLVNTLFTADFVVLGSYVSNHAPAAGSVAYFDDVKVSATGPIGDGVTRRDYAVDLNSKSGLVFSGLDLHNAGVSNFKSGGASYSASSVRSLYGPEWQAPSDPTLPTPLTQVRDIGFAVGSAWIASNGDIYIHDAASRVRKSTDGGANWTTLKTFADGGLTGSAIRIDSRGYIHACPYGGASSAGIWTSTDGGTNWTLKLDLTGAAQPAGIWGFDEDTAGNLYAGVYIGNVAGADAEIHKSTDGLNWSKVYDNGTDRHVHSVAVDRSTDYVYAAVGDNSAPWYSTKILRTIDGGTNWTQILPSLPQVVGLLAQDGYRLFGFDTPGSQSSIYRTTNDTAFSEVLSTPKGMDCLWIRKDPDTGYIYAGFGGATQTSGTAGVWMSSDSGATWEQVLALPITAATDGTNMASNIVGGKILIGYVSGGANAAAVYSVR